MISPVSDDSRMPLRKVTACVEDIRHRGRRADHRQQIVGRGTQSGPRLAKRQFGKARHQSRVAARRMCVMPPRVSVLLKPASSKMEPANKRPSRRGTRMPRGRKQRRLDSPGRVSKQRICPRTGKKRILSASSPRNVARPWSGGIDDDVARDSFAVVSDDARRAPIFHRNRIDAHALAKLGARLRSPRRRRPASVCDCRCASWSADEARR